MEWIFYYLIQYPEIQERLFDEIHDTWGSRTPTLTEKESTPYLSAFLEEVMRYCPLTFFAVPHSNYADTTLGGYNFPKDTMVR